MAEKKNKNRLILGGLLTGTLIAAYFAPPLKEEGVALTPREQHTAAATTVRADTGSVDSRSSSGVPQDITVLAIKPRSIDDSDEKTGVFNPVNWTPARERTSGAIEQALPPEIIQPPQAPPLPFKFLGKFTQNGIVTIFLQFKDKNLVVNVGDTIAEVYKVESLDNGVLALNYLPLNQKQTLDVGAKN